MVLFSKGSELPASLMGPGAGICSPDDPNTPCGSQDSSPRRLQLSPHLAESLLRRTRAPGGSEGQEPARNAGDPGSIPGLRRSRGEGNGYPLQYPCLGNPMDRGARRGTVHGVAKSLIRLSLLTL